VTTEANGSGQISGLVVPEAVYDVIVAPASGSSERLGASVADLSAGQTTPASFSASTTATITGTVSTGAGAPVPGARVTAWPQGVLANTAGAGATATSDSSGAFSLSVVGGEAYELVIDSADMRFGRSRTVVTAPAAGGTTALGSIAMRAAIRVSGTVTIPGVAGGAAGVHVMLLCYECSGVEAVTPIAEAVSNGSGGFALALPDPSEDGG
jgi:hypothetical protein